MELGRTPVAVVCAGAKSILDLPRTLEILESYAVPVVGYGTGEFPAFYMRSCGEPVSARVGTPAEAAALNEALERRLRDLRDPDLRQVALMKLEGYANREIAERLGDRNLARDVGQALGQNPIPVIVPCHRVLAAGGKVGGFSAPGGIVTKLRLLTIEGAQPGGPTLFDRLPLQAPRRRMGS